jgi:hypothetical protein
MEKAERPRKESVLNESVFIYHSSCSLCEKNSEIEGTIFRLVPQTRIIMMFLYKTNVF